MSWVTLLLAVTNSLAASVLSRNWAKLNKAHFDIVDAHLTLDQLSYRGEGSDEIGPYV